MTKARRPRPMWSSRGSILTEERDPLTLIGSETIPMPSGCMAYRGELHEYHMFRGRNVHRWVWEAIHGPILNGDHVHHVCENPGCVNPKHLRRLSPEDHRAEHDHPLEGWPRPDLVF